MSEDWFWEGNVVKALADYLEREGWHIEYIANTEKREKGIDLKAHQEGRFLLVEVKGFPSTGYQRGPNKGLPKKARPTTQATGWYGKALLSAILLKESYPTADVAIAFPDFPTFRNLVNRTRKTLRILGISVYCVKEDKSVTKLDLEL